MCCPACDTISTRYVPIVPEGHCEISPAFQRWVDYPSLSRPGGTIDRYREIGGFESSQSALIFVYYSIQAGQQSQKTRF